MIIKNKKMTPKRQQLLNESKVLGIFGIKSECHKICGKTLWKKQKCMKKLRKTKGNRCYMQKVRWKDHRPHYVNTKNIQANYGVLKMTKELKRRTSW